MAAAESSKCRMLWALADEYLDLTAAYADRGTQRHTFTCRAISPKGYRTHQPQSLPLTCDGVFACHLTGQSHGRDYSARSDEALLLCRIQRTRQSKKGSCYDNIRELSPEFDLTIASVKLGNNPINFGL